MSLSKNITKESLAEMLGRPVDDAHLLIAKNVVFGAGAHELSELLGVDKSEIESTMDLAEYKEVYTLVAAQYNRTKVATAFNWDDIEARALENIAKRIDREPDIEVNLRIASMANRAQRRQPNQDAVLDAGRAGEKVTIQLTERVIKRLTNQGADEGVERQISITGRHINPTFQDVQEFFSPKHAIIPNEIEREHSEEDISTQAILERLRK